MISNIKALFCLFFQIIIHAQLTYMQTWTNVPPFPSQLLYPTRYVLCLIYSH